MTGTKSEHLAPFVPLPWQVKPWRDMGLEVLLTGSAGGGKSRLAGEKVHGFCKKYPNAMGLMVRKTRNSMTNSTVLFMDRTVIGKDSQVTHLQSKNRFEYSNGSVLAYGGMANEEQREQLRSIGQGGSLDIVWVEEANKLTEDDFNELLARLRGMAAPWCQVILTTNPGPPTHWIYKRLIQGGESSTYYSGALDNPYNAPEYIETLKKLTGVLGLRLRDGKWVQAEGAVYEEWDESLHHIAPFPIPDSWRRWRTIDFGYTNPFVCHWWAEDHDGRLYMYREIYMTQRIVEDHVADILSLSAAEAELIVKTWADHDAEDRATAERHGVKTEAAAKDVSAGIQSVKARLRKAGDGKPRLFVFRDALVEVDRALETKKRPICTADEFTAYAWAKTQEGKANKEAPVKDNDHGMDAVRYMVYSLEQKSAILETASNPFYG